MTLDISFLPQIAYAFVLLFARVGTMIMLMPALGERSVPARMRLSAALAIAFVLYPAARPYYGELPGAFGDLLALLFAELAIGFAIGLIARLILSALTMAGTVIAMQMGLGFVQSVDPAQGTQGALFSNFLNLLGIALIFATDLHHVFIRALGDSFVLFAPGTLPPSGDFAELAVETIARGFQVAMQISAPFLIFGLLFYAGLGVISRLMPQIQIFFIAMPANIMIGLLLFGLVLTGLMTWFLGYAEETAVQFLAG